MVAKRWVQVVRALDGRLVGLHWRRGALKGAEFIPLASPGNEPARVAPGKEGTPDTRAEASQPVMF